MNVDNHINCRAVKRASGNRPARWLRRWLWPWPAKSLATPPTVPPSAYAAFFAAFTFAQRFFAPAIILAFASGLITLLVFFAAGAVATRRLTRPRETSWPRPGIRVRMCNIVEDVGVKLEAGRMGGKRKAGAGERSACMRWRSRGTAARATKSAAAFYCSTTACNFPGSPAICCQPCAI